MPVRQPRYSKEEIARRGDEIYEFQVRSQVEAANYGRIVASTLKLELLRLQMISFLRQVSCLSGYLMHNNPGLFVLDIEQYTVSERGASKNSYDAGGSQCKL